MADGPYLSSCTARLQARQFVTYMGFSCTYCLVHFVLQVFIQIERTLHIHRNLDSDVMFRIRNSRLIDTVSLSGGTLVQVCLFMC